MVSRSSFWFCAALCLATASAWSSSILTSRISLRSAGSPSFLSASPSRISLPRQHGVSRRKVQMLVSGNKIVEVIAPDTLERVMKVCFSDLSRFLSCSFVKQPALIAGIY